MPEGGGKLEEIYRLAKENNQMLRAMRRNARFHAIFKMLFYILIAVVAVWMYVHYLLPLLEQALKALSQVQGASSQAQSQIADWQHMIDSFRDKIPGLSSTSTR